MIEWCFFDYAKSFWLDASSYANFVQALQTAFPCFPLLADVFMNHFISTMHDLTQAVKKSSSFQEKWACQLKRIIHWTESMPCLVNGLSFKSILNIITSFSASQNIPNVLSIGRLPVKSFSFAPSLLSASEIWNNISFLLLMNFVSLNPPLFHRSLTSWISVRTSLTDGTDFTKST